VIKYCERGEAGECGKEMEKQRRKVRGIDRGTDIEGRDGWGRT
jgi:hypothetical protein